MWSLVKGVTAFFDWVIGLFGSLHPMIGLLVVSVITGVVMLIIFRYTSNQGAIARTKELIKAYILEIRLFKDDLRLQMAAQRRILVTNLKYMRYALMPMLFMLIPVVIILIQLDVRYARRPFLPGEKTLVKVRLAENADLNALALDPPEGITVETPPLRIPGENEVDWRVRVDEEGSHDLVFRTGAGPVTKRIEAGDRVTKLADGRYLPSFLGVWEHPAESPLDRALGIRSIEISYPDRRLELWGFGMHWLLVFFVVSVVFGYAIKGFVGVEV